MATAAAQDDGPAAPGALRDQWALALVTGLVLVGSLAFVAWLFL